MPRSKDYRGEHNPLSQAARVKVAKKALSPQRHTVKPRIGSRPNSDGTASTHLMKHEVLPDGNWVAFPTLFQDPGGAWIDRSQEEKWMPVYEEAKRRGEVYDFGKDMEKAEAFGQGSWKEDR